MTSAAGSGHPTSSLSAVELAAVLFFAGFLKNSRFVLSKGHASPLLYALYHVGGVIKDAELKKYRTFKSNLEGHPTPRLPFVDVATGSLGQGLSAGVGMALGIKLQETITKKQTKELPKVFVLLGDSEFSEGQIYEALQLASYYKLNNLIGILDVNRLGQRGETMLGWDVKTYKKRAESFGWNTIVVEDGHDLKQVYKAFEKVVGSKELGVRNQQPIMIMAKTVKGKGVSFLENQDGWHGKPVPKDKLGEALKELGEVDLNLPGKLKKSENTNFFATWEVPSGARRGFPRRQKNSVLSSYELGSMVATREAYGDALVALGNNDPTLVVLDAEVANSTYAERFKKAHPERFFEMFIAEQNMVSTALGLSKIGYNVFSSSFAAFFTRAFDQLRMAQYSKPNLKFCGSHAGVSIGADGPSQMALEDFAMMRSLLESVVFHPADAVSTFKLVEFMARSNGLFYLRTMREKTPVLYKEQEKFEVGGSKILRQSGKDKAVVFATGITLHEALKAYDELNKKGINIAVVDMYSIKPFNHKTISTLKQLAKKTGNVVVAEDHYPTGGLGEAIAAEITRNKIQVTNFDHLAVTKIPRSGKPEELLSYEQIDAKAIIKSVKDLT